MVSSYILQRPVIPMIRAFHGTSKAGAAKILAKGFEPSVGPGEWLGHGVYFWESIRAAWWWARKKYGSSAAVIGAGIYLGYSLDIDNLGEDVLLFKEVYEALHAEHRKSGVPLPRNDGEQKELECLLINRARQHCLPPFETVVRTFAEGGVVVPGTSFQSMTWRQLCVCNVANIRHPEQLMEDA